MEGEGGPLEKLAEAVLLGSPVDWASVESSAGAPYRAAIRKLRVLAAIAELHRTVDRDVPASTQPGRWGRLELLEKIGRGSFGEVYRAWDSRLDREVAVKLLHDDMGNAEGDAVLREARLLARVRHPNVVTVYDADEIEDRVGLWMEFIHGRNLEEVLRERGKFDDREVTRIGIELCRALTAVHDAGLLHRDIKAQNLMRTDDGRLILMDFGTGREFDDSSAPVDTAGTPLYLAPEVFGGAAAAVPADIYSAGVLLFHLLTCSYPVRGTTVSEVGEAHARGERQDLPAKAPGADKALAAVIARAIQPDPSSRFESARDMLRALENVQRRRETGKRKRYWFSLGAVSLAAAAVVVIQGVNRRNPGRSAASPYFGVNPEKRAVQIPQALMFGTPAPDGKYLPYSESGTGNLALYEFATGASRVLTKDGDGGSRYATESVVSPDGSQIAYFWVDGSFERGQLRVIGTQGGDPRILSTAINSTGIDPLEWSPDGRQILGWRQRPGGETEVVLVSPLDGSVKLLRTFEHAPLMLGISPDNRYLAYDRAEDAGDTDRGIFISAMAGVEEIPVVTGRSYDSHPMWTPNGSGLVFASLRTGTPSLWLQRVRDGRPDGNPELLDKNMGAFAPITLTRRGSLFYRHRTGTMDVYTVSIDPATGDIHGEPKAAASRVLGSNLAADWSPDGSTVVFASWRTLFGPGRNILVFHPLNGEPERELAIDVDLVNVPRWSADGRLIAVGGADRKGVRALRLVDADSGSIVSTFFPLPGDAPSFNYFVWAPDGKHAYLKRQGKISRFDVATGELTPIYPQPSDSFLGSLALSPDGRWLAFQLNVRQDKTSRLVVIPAAGGDSRELVKLSSPARLSNGDWTRDGKQILFVRITQTEKDQFGEVWAVPFEGGEARSLGLTMPSLRDLCVSPAGDRISFTSGFPEQNLWVFENFLSK